MPQGRPMPQGGGRPPIPVPGGGNPGAPAPGGNPMAALQGVDPNLIAQIVAMLQQQGGAR